MRGIGTLRSVLQWNGTGPSISCILTGSTFISPTMFNLIKFIFSAIVLLSKLLIGSINVKRVYLLMVLDVRRKCSSTLQCSIDSFEPMTRWSHNWRVMHILVRTQRHYRYISTRIDLEFDIMTINLQINEPSSRVVLNISYSSDKKFFLRTFRRLCVSAVNFGYLLRFATSRVVTRFFPLMSEGVLSRARRSMTQSAPRTFPLFHFYLTSIISTSLASMTLSVVL